MQITKIFFFSQFEQKKEKKKQGFDERLWSVGVFNLLSALQLQRTTTSRAEETITDWAPAHERLQEYCSCKKKKTVVVLNVSEFSSVGKHLNQTATRRDRDTGPRLLMNSCTAFQKASKNQNEHNKVEAVEAVGTAASC